MSNPLRYFDSNSTPEIPDELVKLGLEQHLQCFIVHLLHGDGHKDVHYVTLGGFLPRVGEDFRSPEGGKYVVSAVLHVLGEAKLPKVSAYVTKSHVMCVPKEQ